MPHQCVHCGKIYPIANKALIEGCDSCGGHFFFYIREEQIEMAKQQTTEIPQEEKKQVERDIREMAGIKEEDVPVILDFESVKVIAPGKFQIDLVNLFKRDAPLVYQLEEGKYIIDLSYALIKDKEERNKEEQKENKG